MNSYIERIIKEAEIKNNNQPEFIQALKEVLTTLEPIINSSNKYEKNAILERMTEPERIVMFRVPWVDDNGKIQVNRGYRVQFSSNFWDLNRFLKTL